MGTFGAWNPQERYQAESRAEKPSVLGGMWNPEKSKDGDSGIITPPQLWELGCKFESQGQVIAEWQSQVCLTTQASLSLLQCLPGGMMSLWKRPLSLYVDNTGCLLQLSTGGLSKNININRA